MTDRDWLTVPQTGLTWQERAEEAEAENAILHGYLLAQRKTSESLVDYGNKGWARVAELAAEKAELEQKLERASRPRILDYLTDKLHAIIWQSRG